MFPNWVMNFDDRCHKLIDGGGNELEAESAGEAEDEDEEGQEYGYKAAEWTEDDQMDLMDLGTSEIERSKTITLKQGINKRLKEVKDRADIKEKIEALKAELNNSKMPLCGRYPSDPKLVFLTNDDGQGVLQISGPIPKQFRVDFSSNSKSAACGGWKSKKMKLAAQCMSI